MTKADILLTLRASQVQVSQILQAIAQVQENLVRLRKQIDSLPDIQERPLHENTPSM